MNESAFVFFTLLNESYAVDAGIRLTDMAVVSFPHLEQGSGKEVLDSFKSRTDDILDLSEENQSTTEEIKKAFNQR